MRAGAVPGGVRDAGVAAGAVLLAVLIAAQSAGGQPEARELDRWSFGLVIVAAGALAWRRRAPIAALALTVAANGIYLLADYPYGPSLLCTGWAMFGGATCGGWPDQGYTRTMST
jgi:hypothetical protein